MASKAHEVIRRGGHMIYSASIERSLCSLEAVQEAVVVGVPEGRSFQLMWGCVVLHEKHLDIAEDELHEHSQKLTEEGKVCEVPDRFLVLKNVPTVNGMVDRAELKRRICNPFALPKCMPRAPTEQTRLRQTPKLKERPDCPANWYSVNERDIIKPPAPVKAGLTRGGSPSAMAMEETISAFPPVDQVAVVHVKNINIQKISAFVVLRPSHVDIVDELDLHHYARNAKTAGKLAQVPDQWRILEDMPTGKQGDPDREALAKIANGSHEEKNATSTGDQEEKSASPRRGFSFRNQPYDSGKGTRFSKVDDMHDTNEELAMEKALKKCLAGVRAVAVVSLRCTVKYKLTVACVVLEDENEDTTKEEVFFEEVQRSIVLKQINICRPPDRFCILPELPQGRNAPVDKSELKKILESPFMTPSQSTQVTKKSTLSGRKTSVNTGKKPGLLVQKSSRTPAVSTAVIQKVEASVQAISVVESAAVVAIPVGNKLQMLWAFVTLKASYIEHIEECELHAAIQTGKWAGEQPVGPDRFVVLDELPRGPGLSTDKDRLRDMISTPFCECKPANGQRICCKTPMSFSRR